MDQNQPGPSTSSPSTSLGSTTTTKIHDLDSHLRTIILGLENASGNGEKVPWTLPDKTKAALVAKAKLHLDNAIPIKPRKETVPVKECWTPETTRTTTTPEESNSATKRRNGPTFSALQRGIALRAPHSTISMLTWPQRHVPWWSAGSGGGKGDDGSEGDAASIMSKDNGKEDPDEVGTNSGKGSSKASCLPTKKTLLIFFMGMITGSFLVLFSLSLTDIELDLDDAACAGCVGPVANGLVGKEAMNDTRGRSPRNIVPRQDGKRKNATTEGQGKESNNHVSTKDKVGSGKSSPPSATTATLVTTTKRPASGITTTRFQESHTVAMTPTTTSPLAASITGRVDDGKTTTTNRPVGGEDKIALPSPGGEGNSSPFTAPTTAPSMTTSTQMDKDVLPLVSPDPQVTTVSSTTESTTQVPTTIDAVSHMFRQTIGMDLSTDNGQQITESTATLQTETSSPMVYEVTTREEHDVVAITTMVTTPSSEISGLDVTLTTVTAQTQSSDSPAQSELKATSFEASIPTTQPSTTGSATSVTTTELKATSSSPSESSAISLTTESGFTTRVSDIDISSASPLSFITATAASLLPSSTTPTHSSSPSSSPPTTHAQNADTSSPPFSTALSSSSTSSPLSSPSIKLTTRPEEVTSPPRTSPIEQPVTTGPAASPPASPSQTPTFISVQTTPHREDSGIVVTSVSPVYQDGPFPSSPAPPTIQARHDDAYLQATKTTPESSSPRTLVSQDHLTVGRTQSMWTTNAAVTQQTTTTEDFLEQRHTTGLDTTLSPTSSDMTTPLSEARSMDDDETPAEGQQPEAQSEQEQTQQVVSTPRKRKKGWWVRFVEAVKKYVVKVFE